VNENKKSLNYDSVITHTLAIINKWKLGLILSMHLIPSINNTVSDIKSRKWRHVVEMWYTTVAEYDFAGIFQNS